MAIEAWIAERNTTNGPPKPIPFWKRMDVPVKSWRRVPIDESELIRPSPSTYPRVEP
jgi:hypothetical protein